MAALPPACSLFPSAPLLHVQPCPCCTAPYTRYGQPRRCRGPLCLQTGCCWAKLAAAGLTCAAGGQGVGRGVRPARRRRRLDAQVSAVELLAAAVALCACCTCLAQPQHQPERRRSSSRRCRCNSQRCDPLFPFSCPQLPEQEALAPADLPQHGACVREGAGAPCFIVVPIQPLLFLLQLSA